MRNEKLNSNLEQLIYDYIDEIFDVQKLYMSDGFDYDKNEPDPNVKVIARDDGSEVVMEYITKKYYEDYDDDDFKKKWIELTPIVEFLEIKYVSPLEAYFGNKWKPVFKIWFHDNFGLPVKTVV
jgi:hypothetical protein